MDEFVPGAGPPPPGKVYMPRLGRHVLPREAPIQLTRFAARFRALFDADLATPKRLDVDRQFGRLADYLHLNVRDLAAETWRFERFAPAWTSRLGQDLTGENVLHRRYAPYNTNLDEMLRQAVEREMPFYAGTHVGGGSGTEVAHRLLVPMSTTGSTITHCLVFTV